MGHHTFGAAPVDVWQRSSTVDRGKSAGRVPELTAVAR